MAHEPDHDAGSEHQHHARPEAPKHSHREHLHDGHPHGPEASHVHTHVRGAGDHQHGHEEHAHKHSTGLTGLIGGVLRPHSHDAADSVDDALEGSAEGIRAVAISLAGLGLTAVLQLVVALVSGSVGLLADTIHNFADASTAIPLWLAFSIGRRPPTQRYTYGYGRGEDLAGVFVVAIVAASAVVAAWQSIDRLLHPRPLSHVGWIAAAALLGFVGNEFVARYRIGAGQRIGSAALVADGYHARTDGLTSLAVLLGAGGAWFGFDHLDAIVGLAITAAILFVLKDASVQVWQRLMDAVDPGLVSRLEEAARSVTGVDTVSSVRLRWIGHNMHAEALIVADGDVTLGQGHAIGEQARHAMLHAVPKLAGVTVHVDPLHSDGRDAHADLAHHDVRTPTGLR